jgi:hypothetical protein
LKREGIDPRVKKRATAQGSKTFKELPRSSTLSGAKDCGDVLTMGSAKGEERQPFKFHV